MKISVLTPSIRPEMLHITQKALEQQTFQDFEWLVEVGLHDKGFTLPADMNKMLKRAKGGTIISLQDCIDLPPDALERIAELDYMTAYTFPVGKRQRDDGVLWDWRMTRAKLEGDSITPNMWETDLASAPIRMFYDIGGYDEEFAKGWSFDNVEVAWRASAIGYCFKVSTVTQGVAIDHDALMEHPHRNKLPLNDHRANKTMEDARRGNHIRLQFL